MSAKIDEKVVEMRFDNGQFEKNVHTSISTLDRLKSAINFKHAGNSFRNLNAEAKKCDMSTLSKAADAVKVKFSALEVAGVTAMTRITNAVMNTGKQMVKSLTIDPIKGGFSTYELKTNSVQTIMASTGESIETVTKAIKELNTYSDKTIYHFSDMMSNIGKFTNAGVSLEDAKQAMIGISNEAARSGANAMEASRAMYNLAQSMSMGYVQYIDWKSIENANMATKEFKTQLIETAVAMGTMTKAADGYTTAAGHTYSLQQSFKDGMKDQWLTTDVLVKTLGNYADVTTDIGKKSYAAATEIKTFTQLMDVMKESAATGWSTTWETLFGNLIEAKQLWTSVNNVIGGYIGKMAEVRNETLTDWKRMGGRQTLIDAVADSFHALVKVLQPVGEAFRNIFPRKTASDLLRMTEKLKQFTEQLMISDEAAEKIKNTFKGFFSIFRAIGNVAKMIFKAVSPLLRIFSMLGSAALYASNELGNMVSQLMDWVSNNSNIRKIFDILASKINLFSKSIVNLGKKIKDLSKDENGISSIKTFFENLATILSKYINKEQIKRILDDYIGYLKQFKEKVTTIFLSVRDRLMETLGKLSGIIASAGIIGIVKNLTGVAAAVSLVAVKFSDVMGALKKAINNIGHVLKSYNFKAIGQGILSMSISIGILAAAVVGLAYVFQYLNGWDIVGALATVGVLGLVVSGLAYALAKIGGLTKIAGLKATAGVAMLVVSVAASLMMMVSAFNALSDVEIEKVTDIFTVFGILAVTLIDFIGLLKLIDPKSSIGIIFSVIGLAGSMYILVETFKRLGIVLNEMASNGMSGDAVWKPLLVMLGGILTVIGLMASAKHVSIGGAFGFLASILALRLVLETLSDVLAFAQSLDFMDGLNIGTMLVSIIVSIGALMKATSLIGADALKAGGAILMMSTALLIMIPTLYALGHLAESGVIGKAVGSVLGILGLFAAITALSHFAGENAIKAGVMLALVSTGLLMISAALLILSTISFEGLAQGVLAIMSLGVMFKMLIEATALAKACKAEILMIGITIGILAASLAVLSLIEPVNLAAATLALMGVMAMFALVIAASSVAAGAIGALIVLTVAIGMLGAVLYILASLPDASAVVAVALGISVAMTSLAITCAILTVVGAAAPAALAGVLVLLSLIFALQSLFAGISLVETYIDPSLAERIDRGIELVEKIAYGLGRIAGSALEGVADSLPHIGEQFAQFFEALSGIDPNISTSLKTLAEAAMIITGKDIAEAFSRFIPGKNSSLISFMNELTLLVEPLKQFSKDVEDIDGDNISSSVSAISALASVSDTMNGHNYSVKKVTQMKEFLDQMNPLIESAVVYSENAVNVKSYAITNSTKALKAIADLSKSIDDIKEIKDNRLSVLISELDAISKPLADYSKNVEKINTDSINTSTSAIDGLLRTGKVINEFKYNSAGAIGETGLGGFIHDLDPIMYSVGNLSKKSENISVDAITGMADAITSIAGLSELEIKSDGSEISPLIRNLNALSGPLSAYAEGIKSVDFTKITEATDAITSMNTAAKEVSETDYDAEKLSGDSGSLNSFIVTLTPMLDNIKSLGESAQNISNESITKIVDAMTGISTISQLKYESDGSNLTTLVNNLNSITGPLSEYSAAVEGIKTDKITESTTVLSALNDIASTISASEYDMAKISGDSSINSFITSFTPFVDTINAFSEKAKSIETASLDTAVANVTKVANLGTIIPDGSAIANIASFGTELGNLATSLLSYTTTMSGVTTESVGTATANFEAIVGSLSSSMEAFSGEFNTYGLSMMQNLSNGIDENTSLPTDSVNTVVETIKTTLNDTRDAAYTSGQHFAEGFATGINDFASLAIDAATTMASGAANATKVELDERSPSKVAFGIGKFYSMGAANGIKKYSNLVSMESTNLGEMAITGLQNAVSKIQSFIDTDMNTQPVIRPIVDISDAKRSVHTLSNMFNKHQVASIQTAQAVRQKNEFADRTTSYNPDSSVVFNQYNTSPKALSRTEIYRQTRNQLSKARGLSKI